MPSLKPLETTLFAFLTPPMAHAGFRRKGRYFKRPISMGSQYLDIEIFYEKGTLEVAPNLAIGHQELEETYRQIIGERPGRDAATIGTGYNRLGDDKPRTWVIREPEEVIPAGRSILYAFSRTHKRFFERFGTLEQIFEALTAPDPELKRYCPIPHLRAGKSLVAAYLLGKRAEFDQLIDTHIQELSGNEQGQLRFFLEFAVMFRKFVKEQDEHELLFF